VAPITIHRNAMSRRTKFAAGTFAVAAAVLVGVLSINLVRADHHVTQLSTALIVASHRAVEAALETPGHVNVTLNANHHSDVAQFVLVHGHGYLVSSTLATLSSAKTYQLWGIIAGKPISIGLMGTAPSNVTFTVAGSPQPTELAVTIEPAGGSVTPTTPIVASGTLTA
jgi:anti-sigma-K factor RskA